jgi:hypothetical protein
METALASLVVLGYIIHLEAMKFIYDTLIPSLESSRQCYNSSPACCWWAVVISDIFSALVGHNVIGLVLDVER